MLDSQVEVRDPAPGADLVGRGLVREPPLPAPAECLDDRDGGVGGDALQIAPADMDADIAIVMGGCLIALFART